MKIIRGGMKAPLVTAWQSAVTLTIVGTAVSESARMRITMPAEHFSEMAVQLRFTATRTVQVTGTEVLYYWWKFTGLYSEFITTADFAMPLRYTYRSRTGHGFDVIDYIKVPLYVGNELDSDPQIRIWLQARTLVNAEYELSNIASRFIYTPL